MSSKYIFEEDEIICEFLNCAGGMGLAGNGHCYLNGEANKEDCNQFEPDEDFQKQEGE